MNKIPRIGSAARGGRRARQGARREAGQAGRRGEASRSRAQGPGGQAGNRRRCGYRVRDASYQCSADLTVGLAHDRAYSRGRPEPL